MTPSFWTCAAVCAAALAALLVANARGRAGTAAVCKTVASLAFVAAALAQGAATSPPGALLVAGLACSLGGDVALAKRGAGRAFLVGLGAFLLAHLLYAGSFLARGVDGRATLVAAAPLALAAAAVLRALLPRVKRSLQAPVAIYVGAISLMVALAIGAAARDATALLVVGAILFWASDLAVARERFVVASPWNGRIGLPLYYAAQLVLASTGPGP